MGTRFINGSSVLRKKSVTTATTMITLGSKKIRPIASRESLICYLGLSVTTASAVVVTETCQNLGDPPPSRLLELI